MTTKVDHMNGDLISELDHKIMDEVSSGLIKKK